MGNGNKGFGRRLIVAILALSVLYTLFSEPQDARRYSAAPINTPSDTSNASLSPAYSVKDIENIVRTSRSNDLRFDRDYAGHGFSGYMILDSISETFGSYVVSFKKDSSSFLPDVRCTATKNVASSMIDWQAGDRVYVSGVIERTFMGSISLSHCEYNKQN